MNISEPEERSLQPAESDGPFLRKHRKAAGVTMTAVAAEAGLSISYLSLIETGKKHPPLDTVVRIANAIAVASRRAA